MIESIIPTIIIILIMVIITFIILKTVTNRINKKVKVYFIDKLQEYNYLIEQKEAELNRINEIIEKYGKNIPNSNIKEIKNDGVFSSEIEQRLKEMQYYKNSDNTNRIDKITTPATPKFREDTFFNVYKELRKNFKTNNEKIIKKFEHDHKVNAEELEKYKALINLKQQFNPKIVYDILTLKNEEQYEIVEESISNKEKELIEFENKFNVKNKFNILDMLKFIDEKIKEYDPTIYVYVGDYNLNYDNLGENIKTEYYKNMSEGIIIHYKGKIYDYSI